MESDKVVLDGGFVDLDPAKLASISTTAPVSSVSDPLTRCNSDQVWFLKTIMEFVRVTGNTFSNPLLSVVVQATYQFGVAHFSQIGNLDILWKRFLLMKAFHLCM